MPKQLWALPPLNLPPLPPLEASVLPKLLPWDATVPLGLSPLLSCLAGGQAAGCELEGRGKAAAGCGLGAGLG
jgi:hypothetical protein